MSQFLLVEIAGFFCGDEVPSTRQLGENERPIRIGELGALPVSVDLKESPAYGLTRDRIDYHSGKFELLGIGLLRIDGKSAREPDYARQRDWQDKKPGAHKRYRLPNFAATLPPRGALFEALS
jgi:hypothetical protein